MTIRTLLAQLELVSHAPIQGYEFAPSEVGRGQRNRTSNRKPPIPHLGAHRPQTGDTKAPRGNDVEYRPRPPKAPRVVGDARSEKAWDDFEEELAAWKCCYQRRTVGYFRRRLDKAVSDGELRQIRLELEETIGAWRVMPSPAGQPPSRADPQWKQWIADSAEDAGVLADRFSTTRRHINRIRQQYGRFRAA